MENPIYELDSIIRKKLNATLNTIDSIVNMSSDQRAEVKKTLVGMFDEALAKADEEYEEVDFSCLGC